jgi:hypothetical protein
MESSPYVYQSSISLVLAHNKGNHSYEEGSSEIMDPTNNSSTTTKTTHTVLKTKSVLHNTYYDRMESNDYVKRTNIRLVQTITWAILYSYRKGLSE